MLQQALLIAACFLCTFAKPVGMSLLAACNASTDNLAARLGSHLALAGLITKPIACRPTSRMQRKFAAKKKIKAGPKWSKKKPKRRSSHTASSLAWA